MQIVKLNLIPGGVLPVCFASQHDTGRVIRFMLFEGEDVFTLSGAESIALRLKKPDGSELVESVTNTGADYVDVVTTADTCDTAGASVGEIAITDGGDVLGSANFGLFVESDAFEGGGIVTQTATGAIATFETNIETAFVSLKSEINPVQDLHGYSKPWSGGGGKNKLDYLSYLRATSSGLTISATSGGAIHYQGTATVNYCQLTYIFNLSIPSGTTVTVSRDVAVGHQHYFDFTFTDNSVEYVRIMPNTTSTTYTLPKDLKSIDIVCLGLAVGTAYNETVKFQLEYGSQATSWEPYSNICPISGFSALNVTRTGVNLWNEQWEVGYISVLDGRNSSSQVNIRSKNYIPIKPNVSLYLKANIATVYCPIIFYDKDKNFLSSVAQTLWNRTITTPENAYYMRFYMNDRYGTTYNNDISINYPSSDTEYHAYNGQTVTVNFGQTVYGGVAGVTSGKVNVTHGIVDLGTLDWSAAGNMWFASLSGVKPISDTTVPNAICTQYKAVSWASGTSGTEEGVFCFLPTYNQLRVRDTSYSSASDFKTAMSGVMLVYELATPIEITTTPENLTALSGQNNVYGDTNGDTEVEYYIEV